MGLCGTRIGIKNEKGVYVTPAFPKLVYVLDEHNCLKGGKYDYITKLAAKCNTKRLVPDYQSAKIMRKNYENNLRERYKITEDIKSLMHYEILELIGRKRGALISGGEVDTFKAAGFLLDDFRAAKIGKITLEQPE